MPWGWLIGIFACSTSPLRLQAPRIMSQMGPFTCGRSIWNVILGAKLPVVLLNGEGRERVGFRLICRSLHFPVHTFYFGLSLSPYFSLVIAAAESQFRKLHRAGM